MSKKKRGKAQKQSNGEPIGTSRSSRPGDYRFLTSPFSGVPDGEVASALRSLGEESDRAFQEAFRQLDEQTLAVDPIMLLSVFAYHDLTRLAGDPYRGDASTNRPQSDLELLQALILRHHRTAFNDRPVLWDGYRDIGGLLTEATTAFRSRQFARVDESSTGTERHRFAALEHMRLHTQVVRNWGHAEQVMRIVTELFAPLDSEIETIVGVRVGHLVQMWDKLAEVIQQQMTAHTEALAPAMSAKNIPAAAEAYHRTFTGLQSRTDDLIALAEERGLSLRQLRAMLHEHSNLSLPGIFTFTLDELRDLYPGPVTPEALGKVLNGWALSFGDLASHDPHRFFLSNPVWRQPLIRLADCTYFVPIAGLFFSFCIELMESLAKSSSALMDRYTKRRAAYLEEKVAALFAAALPKAQLYRGSQWVDPTTGKQMESDLLVVMDAIALVVEAKSGRVTDPARRGAQDRIAHTIDEIVVAPSEQSSRFASFLATHPRLHRFSTKSGQVNTVDTANIHRFGRLSISLDWLGDLQGHWPELRRAGFVPATADIAATLTLADLEIVLDILESPSERLHYLLRRSEFEEHVDYIGDEMDVLGFYLDTGFNIGESEFDGTGFFLTGQSQPIDAYYVTSGEKRKAPKPHRRRSKWWRDLVQRVEDRHPPRWIELGYIMHNVAYADQLAIEERFRRVQDNLRRNWRPGPQSECVSVLIGPPQRRDAFVVFACKRANRNQRKNMIEAIVGDSRIWEEAERAVVVGVDLDAPEYPYSLIALVAESDRS